MHRVGLLMWLVLALAAPSSFAGVLTFNIDSTQSFFHYAITSGDFSTQYSSPQTPGSDQTSVSGTLNIDVTSNSIQFLPTNDAHPANQNSLQAPLIDGSPGTSIAQIGLNIEVAGIGSGVVAIRNYVADLTSSVISLSSGSFDATNVNLGVSGGTTAYNLVAFGFPLVGSFMGADPGQNLLSGGTLSLVGDTYTLTLPYLVNSPEEISGVSIGLVHSGVIVATAVVPEPGTLLLASLGLVAWLGWSLRKR